MMRAALKSMLVPVMLGLPACSTSQDSGETAPIAPAAVTDRVEPDGPSLSRDLNTARVAAMTVATMPALGDPATRLEVRLQAALYRLGVEQSKSSHVLLEPLDESVLPPLSISVREFRLRVLGELAGAGALVAWGEPAQRGGINRFPGLREPVPSIRLVDLDRQADQAVVGGEIVINQPDGHGRRVGFNATWDGQAWAVDANRATVSW